MAEMAPASLFPENTEPEFEYRSTDPWALIGLVLGLISPLAMLATLLLLIPPLGVLANTIALGRIRADETRSGRGAALAGLALSVFFIALPATQALAVRVLVWRQARPTADAFFELLREQSPEKAFMLKVWPENRHAFDEGLWAFYRNNKRAQRELREFVSEPPVRTLLALGDRAQVRYYKTIGAASDEGRVVISYWYTVTYDDDDGKKTTYLLRIIMERMATHSTTLPVWRVKGLSGSIDPATSRY